MAAVSWVTEGQAEAYCTSPKVLEGVKNSGSTPWVFPTSRSQGHSNNFGNRGPALAPSGTLPPYMREQFGYPEPGKDPFSRAESGFPLPNRKAYENCVSALAWEGTKDNVIPEAGVGIWVGARGYFKKLGAAVIGLSVIEGFLVAGAATYGYESYKASPRCSHLIQG